MLLQAMVLIATMVVLAGVLLTSTLASAHAAFHEMILAKTQTATSDATARFATWAQDQVVRYGTEQSWPTTSQPTNPDRTVGITTPVCDGGPSSTAAPAASCAMAATMRWNVTGWSANANGAQRSSALGSTATNLSTTLHEQRISATITVVLTNARSNAIYASHSRKVTARIFDAYPYVAVTATRDASSEDLTANSLEGDTAGVLYNRNYVGRTSTPSRDSPSGANDTTISTTIDCSNSFTNNDQLQPINDNDTATYHRLRNVGNQAWLFEAPCNPTYAQRINSASAPSDFTPSVGNVYSNNTVLPSRQWTKTKSTAQFSR